MRPDRFLISVKNLRLAWARITTGRNLQHKRYFRHLYATYSVALDENLHDLHTRLKHGSYEPRPPTRFFLPKASGLQRPLTLLCLEDQIVLQALANLFAARLAARRRPMELATIYSNVLEKTDDSIFFLRDWHGTYEAFTRKLRFHYRKGYQWVAAFDLAAYYDTISHDALLKTAFPRGGLGETTSKVASWLERWTTESRANARGHGIPQGPIASDFLGECFMLPIDEAMRGHPYVRYVDDIRLFGRSEGEVRRAAIELERLCRDRGLIPQPAKFSIQRAKSVGEAVGTLPSLGFADEGPEDGPRQVSGETAVREFRKCLKGHPKRIVDKTRARFILYRAAPAQRLLRYVRLLLPHHPEHIDAFMSYLSQFARDDKTITAVRDVLATSPYDYVQGEAWQLLARMMNDVEMAPLLESAMATARNRRVGFSCKWGALAFLCRAEERGLGRYARWALHQESALLQALLAPILPSARIARADVAAHWLRRSACEPGLALAPRLVTARATPSSLGVAAAALPGPVQRVYRRLGLIRGRVRAPEPVGDLLERSIGTPRWDGWPRLLGAEYGHACQLLAQAVPIFDGARSLWLVHQNSFNDAACRAFQGWLRVNNRAGQVALVGRNGRLVTFGALVQEGNPFSVPYPPIAEAFREANDRRNSIPAAHPYSTRSGKRTAPLRRGEQTALVRRLRQAFEEIARLVG